MIGPRGLLKFTSCSEAEAQTWRDKQLHKLCPGLGGKALSEYVQASPNVRPIIQHGYTLDRLAGSWRLAGLAQSCDRMSRLKPRYQGGRRAARRMAQGPRVSTHRLESPKLVRGCVPSGGAGFVGVSSLATITPLAKASRKDSQSRGQEQSEPKLVQ